MSEPGVDEIVSISILNILGIARQGLVSSTLACLLAGCVAHHRQGEKAPTPGARFFISRSELVNVKEKAAKGDVRAINRIADYYMLYEGDEAQGVAWLERLGDTGDAEARENVMSYYRRHPSAENAKHLEDLRSRWDL